MSRTIFSVRKIYTRFRFQVSGIRKGQAPFGAFLKDIWCSFKIFSIPPSLRGILRRQRLAFPRMIHIRSYEHRAHSRLVLLHMPYRIMLSSIASITLSISGFGILVCSVFVGLSLIVYYKFVGSYAYTVPQKFIFVKNIFSAEKRIYTRFRYQKRTSAFWRSPKRYSALRFNHQIIYGDLCRIGFARPCHHERRRW